MIYTAIAWILFITGHLISIPMLRYDLGWLYPTYSKIMIWSCNFDHNENIWKQPEKTTIINNEDI